MENKLKVLFDFQHFQNNRCLAQIIAQTQKRCGNILEDDELSFVSAAGDFNPTKPRKDGDIFDI